MSHGIPISSKTAPAELAGLSSVPATGRVRHPIGLPRQRVTAPVLTSWSSAPSGPCCLSRREVQDGIPPYLLYLTFLIIGSYFGTRTAHTGERHAPSPVSAARLDPRPHHHRFPGRLRTGLPPRPRVLPSHQTRPCFRRNRWCRSCCSAAFSGGRGQSAGRDGPEAARRHALLVPGRTPGCLYWRYLVWPSR